MRLGNVRQSRRLATCVAFSLALVSLFFLLQVVPHSMPAATTNQTAGSARWLTLAFRLPYLSRS